MIDEPLPGMPDEPERPASAGLSPDAARTARAAERIALGVHPLNGQPLHDAAPRDAARTDRGRPYTCGTCEHLIDREWAKCRRGPVSRGPATDVRRWWPACRAYDGPTDASARQ